MVAAAVVGSALVGGATSLSASNKASKAAKQAAASNEALQREQYGQTRTDLQPYTQGGYNALNALLSQYGIDGSGAPAPTQDYDATNYLRNNPDVAAWAAGDNDPTNDAEQARFHYSEYGQDEGRTLGRVATARPEAAAAPDASSFFSSFENSPGYQAQVDAALRAVNVRQGAGKTYFSGGRGIELEGKASDLAAQDYGNWWQRQNQLYQSALSQYNNDRQFANTNYDVDATRSDARYDTDRGYATNQQNTTTQNLFNLLGIGANATSSLAGAGQNYANNMTQNNNQLAANQGNAALSGANSVNNLLSQGLQAYGMFNGAGGSLWGGSGGMRNGNSYSGANYAYPYGQA